MVMATYATEHEHAYVDRELYVPESWAADPARRRAAGMPDDGAFATKPQLATRMLKRIAAAGRLPFRRAVADEGYGRDPGLRSACHDLGVASVFEVPRNLPLADARGRRTRPDEVHRGLRAGAFERRSAGEGTTGARLYDGAAAEVTVPGQPPADGFAHTLLVRTSVQSTTKDGKTGYDVASFLVHDRAGTPVPDTVAGAGLRWKIEEDTERGTDTLGLDQYQVRTWTPWHRHVTLSVLAGAFLTVTRAKLEKDRSPRAGAR
jgi:SRSO17 transposase